MDASAKIGVVSLSFLAVVFLDVTLLSEKPESVAVVANNTALRFALVVVS